MSVRAFCVVLALLSLAQSASAQTAPALRAGDLEVTVREDGSQLIRITEDLRVALIETEGAEVAMRLTPLDGNGTDLGVGRVILLAPLERRDVSLRNIFSASQLDGVQLRVEALRGKGRVDVIASTSDGGALRVAPQAQPVRRRPVRLKSTDALIQDAETSGAISSETAMLYRVYALFSDSRLPAQYRGVGSEVTDSLYLFEVRDRFPSLSPATQELLLPFLTPPAYPGSWADPNVAGKTARATPPQCGIFSGSWRFVESPSGVVRVWYEADNPDALRASAIASEVDSKIWNEFKTLMRRTPVTDQNESCNGASPGLDIYLVESITDAFGVAIPYRGDYTSPSPLFIEVLRTAKNYVVAHEVFHAFQLAFATARSKVSSDYRWWVEGSATWSQDFIYGADNNEQSQSLPLFNGPEKSLDEEDGFISTCKHCYSTYLLPFFVHRKTGGADFVRVAWENCAREPALEALDHALSGGFKEVWPEFVFRNWNRDPMEDYVKWDGLSFAVRPIGSNYEEIKLDGRPDAKFETTISLPRVSATYRHYKFTDPAVRTVAFWNGATARLGQPDEFQVDQALDDQKKGGFVRALIKIRGQDWKIDDWTNRDVVPFCRDRAAERIDELVLIISNSEFSDRDRKLRAADLQPTLWASNIGCSRWEGTATSKVNGSTPMSGNTTIEIRTDAIMTSFGASPPQAIFYSVQGVEQWTLGGDCRGTGSVPVNPGTAFLFTQNFTPPGGTKHRGYIVSSVDSRPISGYECKEFQGSSFVWKPSSGLLLPPWVFNDKIEPPLLEVRADGTIDGSYVDPEGVAQYTWHFEPKAEPDP